MEIECVHWITLSPLSLYRPPSSSSTISSDQEGRVKVNTLKQIIDFNGIHQKKKKYQLIYQQKGSNAKTFLVQDGKDSGVVLAATKTD
ncbi:hypothetical protein C5167_016443 [Papaver somniferum]|nr:hypothetical protein C5167_016443 [Papaver somniferum]